MYAQCVDSASRYSSIDQSQAPPINVNSRLSGGLAIGQLKRKMMNEDEDDSEQCSKTESEMNIESQPEAERMLVVKEDT